MILFFSYSYVRNCTFNLSITICMLLSPGSGNLGMIIGIVMALLLLIIAALITMYCCICKTKREKVNTI